MLLTTVVFFDSPTTHRGKTNLAVFVRFANKYLYSRLFPQIPIFQELLHQALATYFFTEGDLVSPMVMFSVLIRGPGFPNTSKPQVGMSSKLSACEANSSTVASFMKERPLDNFSSPESFAAKTRALTLSGLNARVNLDLMHAVDRSSEIDRSCFVPLMSGEQESFPCP